MATNRTMEDWFLRGGEKPKDNGMQETLPEPPDETPVDDDEDFDDDENDEGGEREFEVVLERKRIVWQEATVRVTADCEETAMSEAEELAEDGRVDGWDDVGPEDYEELEATDVEEL